MAFLVRMQAIYKQFPAHSAVFRQKILPEIHNLHTKGSAEILQPLAVRRNLICRPVKIRDLSPPRRGIFRRYGRGIPTTGSMWAAIAWWIIAPILALAPVSVPA